MTLLQVITRKKNEYKELKSVWFNLSVLDTSAAATHLRVRLDILEHEIKQLSN